MKTPTELLAAKLIWTPNGCLEWTGVKDRKGYGRVYISGKPTPSGRKPRTGAHRLAWTLANGPVPEGLDVLHHCDNPPCCQTEPTEGYPEGHLFVGTNVDNVADCAAKGRRHIPAPKTHCPQKHAYDEANTFVDSRGYPHCRICGRAAAARYGRTKNGKASQARYKAKKVQL